MTATMSCWRVVALLLFAGLAASHPLEDDMSISEDTEVVESTVREVRALPPANFDLEAAGTEYDGSSSGGDKDDVGYLRTQDSKGDKGYQRFNSFHKKGGDSYGFQTESSFGRAHGGDKKGQHHDSGSYSESKDDGEQEGAHSGDTDDGSEVAEYEGAGSDDDGQVYYRGHGSMGDNDDYDRTALRDSSDNHRYGEHQESGGRGSEGDYDHTALRGNSDNHRYGEHQESGGRGSVGDYDHTALRGGSDNHRYGEHQESGGRGYGSHDEDRYGYRP